MTLAGDGDQGGRDPRSLIVDDSAYDFIFYSVKPIVAAGS